MRASPLFYNPGMAILRDLIYGFVAAVTSPVWMISLLRTGKWRTDWSGRFGHVPKEKSEAVNGLGSEGAKKTVMIHAVSVGEVNATRDLIKRISEDLGDKVRIVITATTNTGFDRATELYGDGGGGGNGNCNGDSGGKHIVLRYPFDFTRCVMRFLDAVRPAVVVLVELEVWPTFVETCAKRQIPVCVINGRLSERSYKRYKLVRWLMRKSFASLATCAVQTVDYAQRFVAMGAAKDRVIVTDSMKWDNAKVVEPGDLKGVSELASAIGIDCDKPVVVAGSTGPGEEELLLRQKADGVQLVLVPRKPERFEEVAGVIQRWLSQKGNGAKPRAAGGGSSGVVRRSQCADGTQRGINTSEVFLLDTMGELRKAYALATVVIVGRSLIDLYGSDPIEPIALGKPTVIGPRYGDFADVVEAFREEDGIVVSDDPWKVVTALLGDSERARQLAVNGRRVILSRQGATQRHVALIQALLQQQDSVKT